MRNVFSPWQEEEVSERRVLAPDGCRVRAEFLVCPAWTHIASARTTGVSLTNQRSPGNGAFCTSLRVAEKPRCGIREMQSKSCKIRCLLDTFLHLFQRRLSSVS